MQCSVVRCCYNQRESLDAARSAVLNTLPNIRILRDGVGIVLNVCFEFVCFCQIDH